MDRNILGSLRDFAGHQLNIVILPFWEKNTPDEINGGFLGEVNEQNQLNPDAPKGIILNARLLWAFSAVYGRYRQEKHLVLARRALDYLERSFEDKRFGGYFWTLHPDGSLINGKKQVYAQAFVCYALSEYSIQAGESKAGEKAFEIYKMIEETAFDPVRNGYFEAFSREWAELDDLRLSSLDMNEKKTMNTHLHILEAYTRLYAIKKDPRLRQSIKNLLEVLYNHILNEEKDHLNLFFDENWALKSSKVSYGHDIESAWLMRKSALTIGDPKEIRHFSKVCINLAGSALSGIREKGGLIHEYYPGHKKAEEFEWWAQAEAIVGFLDAWEISGEEKFLTAANNLTRFIEEYFVDKTFGEWYYRVDIKGMPVKGYEKAGFWKCPYHGVRMCLQVMERISKLERFSPLRKDNYPQINTN